MSPRSEMNLAHTSPRFALTVSEWSMRAPTNTDTSRHPTPNDFFSATVVQSFKSIHTTSCQFATSWSINSSTSSTRLQRWRRPRMAAGRLLTNKSSQSHWTYEQEDQKHLKSIVAALNLDLTENKYLELLFHSKYGFHICCPFFQNQITHTKVKIYIVLKIK